MLLSWHEHLAGLGRKHGVLPRTIFVGFDSLIPSSSLQSPLMYFHFKLFGSSHRPRG